MPNVNTDTDANTEVTLFSLKDFTSAVEGSISPDLFRHGRSEMSKSIQKISSHLFDYEDSEEEKEEKLQQALKSDEPDELLSSYAGLCFNVRLYAEFLRVTFPKVKFAPIVSVACAGKSMLIFEL